ncbi:hypothetical protein IFT96_23095 [Pseudomonas fluorescens]|uniref:hypothetical protein n=1 Tax=Pseudomonas paracarnis TaxID=2750625 RepID=UPI00178199A5|nr:hypothetical protein [Pseudomonas paracarnis]MBD8258261.1 hypothetical protein [Pseudomonas fluorescens]MDV3058615.1 hypothetical protein [Pseudomonas paracarnis]
MKNAHFHLVADTPPMHAWGADSFRTLGSAAPGCVGIILLLALCACSSKQQSGVDPTASSTFSLTEVKTAGLSPTELSEQNRELLESKLNEVLGFCLPRLSGYENASAEQAKKAYWLSMSGLIAGSVLVPGLAAASASGNAAAIAGLGGWAGATNFAGQSLKTSGLSGSTIAETRNKIIQKVNDSISVASDGSKTFNERRDALMKARTACIMYEISVPSIPDVDRS